MYPIKEDTAITIPVFGHDASGDAVTGMTDGGFTKRISKNGGAFAAMTVTITEMENGWYSIPLSTSHTDTAGVLSLTFTNASCKQINVQLRVHTRLPDDLAFPATSGRSLGVETDGHVHADVKEWLGTAPLALVAQRVQGDMTAISGDGPAADALEAMLDGTGAVLTLSQFRINSAAVGGAIDIDNSAGPGIKVNAGGSSHALYLIGDGVGSGLQAEGGLTGDGIVGFGGATSGSGIVGAAVTSGSGVVGLGAGAGFDILGDIQGNLSGSVGSVTGTIGGLTASALADFFDTDSGTTYGAAVAGSVVKEIADNAGGSALTEAGIADAVWDEILTAATHNIATSAGRRLRNIQDFGIYDMASVWVDEVGGTSSGTIDGEDATVTNRADDFDNAQTVAISVGLDTVHVQAGNSITLTAGIANFRIWGANYDLALGGQAISGCIIENATVTGTGTGSAQFTNCIVGAATIDPSRLVLCSLTDTLTIGSAGNYQFIQCQSGVAGASTPTVDLGAAVGATTVEFRRWSGGLTLNNVQAGDVVSIDVVSGGTITVNGTGGTVVIRGMCNVVDGSGGSVSISSTSVLNQLVVADQVWEETLADHSGTVGSTAEAIEDTKADTELLTTELTEAGIAAAVWEEDIVSAHGTLATSGRILSSLVQRAETWLTYVMPDSVLGQMAAKDGSNTFNQATDSLEAIRDNMAAGTVDANLVSIDGDLTNGNNATLNLKQLNIVNSAGDALVASSTGSNGRGALLSGNGTGAGLFTQGGSDGRGFDSRGGSTGGEGIFTRAEGGNTSGFRAEGIGTGAGVVGAAQTATGSGFVGVGGSSGQAFRADPGSGDPFSSDMVDQIIDQNWIENIGDHSGVANSTAEALADALTAATGAETQATNARKALLNRLLIENNQLKIFDDNEITVLFTFNLLDENGLPTEQEPFERDPV